MNSLNYSSESWILSPRKYSTLIRLFFDLCSKVLARLVIAIAALVKAVLTIVGYCYRGGKGFIGNNKLRGGGEVISSSKTNSISTNIWRLSDSEYVWVVKKFY